MNLKLLDICNKHYLECNFYKKTKFSEKQNLSLKQIMLSVYSIFEIKLKTILDKNEINNILKRKKWNTNSKTFISLLRFYLGKINELDDFPNLNKLEKFEFSTFNNKNIYDWTAFYRKYIIEIRNLIVHDFEIDESLNNNDKFIFFIKKLKEFIKIVEEILINSKIYFKI